MNIAKRSHKFAAACTTRQLRILLAKRTAVRVERALARSRRCQLPVRTYGLFNESPFAFASPQSRELRFQERIDELTPYTVRVYVVNTGGSLIVSGYRE